MQDRAATDAPEEQAKQPAEERAGTTAPLARVRGRRSHRFLRPLALVLALTVIGALVAGIGRAALGPSYTSEARILWDTTATQYLGDLAGPTDVTTQDRQVDDQKGVVSSDAVIRAAAATLQADPEDVRKAVAVDVAGTTSIFTIDATAKSPQDAHAIAAAVTDAYVAKVRSSGSAILSQKAAGLQVSIDRLNKDAADIGNQLGGLSTRAPSYPVLQNQQQADMNRVADLLQQQEALRSSAAAFPGEARVLQAADVPRGASSWSVGTTALIGGALGLVLGVCAVAFWTTRRAGRRSAPAPISD